MATTTITFPGELTTGMRVRLMRISRGLRCLDVAAMAHVQVADIGRVERGYWVAPHVRRRVLQALSLDDLLEAQP